MTDISASVVSQPISASVSGSSITASVGSSAISVSVAGGIGPQGPSGDAGTGGGASLSNDTPLSPGTASAGTASTASRSDHRHAAPAISDISGLQATIDGKQAAGSYAAASHTHTSSQITDFAAAVAAAAPATTDASALTSGTLSDSRLSSNVITNALLSARQNQTTSAIDVVDRLSVYSANAPVSGAEYWTFFSPTYNLTISQISYASVSASTGVTLARFGLYTMDASGAGTLVARTASDTTLFTSANTVYTRSLDSTGGYPTTYSLVAGTRYAVAVCVVASSPQTIAAAGCQPVVAAVSPRVQGVRTGANDLVTTQGSGQYNGTVTQTYWARLS